MDVTKLTKDLTDNDLAALNEGVQAEIKNRRPPVSLDSIRVGMTPEEKKAVNSAIQNALKEL